jgi:Mg2+/Co2+ transporter CorC
MPEYHEEIHFAHFTFRIDALDKRRIKRVRVFIGEENTDPESE